MNKRANTTLSRLMIVVLLLMTAACAVPQGAGISIMGAPRDQQSGPPTDRPVQQDQQEQGTMQRK